MDDEWRQDQLPHEQVYVPSEKLPDPEADNGDSHLTLLEQVSFFCFLFVEISFWFFLKETKLIMCIFLCLTGTALD